MTRTDAEREARQRLRWLRKIRRQMRRRHRIELAKRYTRAVWCIVRHGGHDWHSARRMDEFKSGTDRIECDRCDLDIRFRAPTFGP